MRPIFLGFGVMNHLHRLRVMGRNINEVAHPMNDLLHFGRVAVTHPRGILAWAAEVVFTREVTFASSNRGAAIPIT